MTARDFRCDRCGRDTNSGEPGAMYAGSMDWWLCEDCTRAQRAFIEAGPAKMWSMEEITAAWRKADYDSRKAGAYPHITALRAALEEAAKGR